MAAAPAAAHTTTSANLPGGTSIEVGVSAPADGALIASPPGSVNIAGTATIGQGAPVANTTLVYVVDRSGSTADPDGCGGNQNADSVSNSVLDCEIAAARELNRQAIAAGTVDQVGAVFFDSTAQIQDSSPVGGFQGLVHPATNSDSDTIPDIEETLRTATFGGGTDFEEAARRACQLVQQSTNPNNIVVFLSDGVATEGGNALAQVPCTPKTATFHAFAVGADSSCTNTGGGRGSLAQIAADTGGTCTRVTNVANLPGVVPGIIASQLTKLELTIDGGAPQDISSSVTPSLPQSGPAAVSYSTTANLAPGDHTLCVTATGSDGGGTGTVTHCHDVVVATIALTPATETNELGTAGQTHTVTATVAAGADGGVAGVEVDFEIGSGPNAGAADSATTDAAGQATFTYTATQGLAGLGTDTITGCFTDSQGSEACETATKLWADTTAPTVTCEPTTNPSAANVPSAGENAKAGQNPDGFYVLTVTDAVDPNPQLTLGDTGSTATFGPFAGATTIKLTQAPGATPTATPGTGAIDWQIRLKGDGALTATDASGNTSAPVACRVAPAPK